LTDRVGAMAQDALRAARACPCPYSDSRVARTLAIVDLSVLTSRLRSANIKTCEKLLLARHSASLQVVIQMSSASVSKEFSYSQSPLSAIPYDRIKENGLRLSLLSDPPGVIEIPGLRYTIVSIHVGPSVYVSCHRGGNSHHGTVVHGDIDIIPAGTPSRWEIKDKDTALVLSLSPELLNAVAEQFDLDARRLEIRNRFQERDPQLENIAWALKAEKECGYPCGRLYFDSLAVA